MEKTPQRVERFEGIVITPENEEELKQILQEAGIDFSLWGKGEAKSISDLFREIKEGESVLIRREGGELIRLVTVAVANVVYRSPTGERYVLYEEKQRLRDGRERARNLSHSISEKIKAGEKPQAAILRGLKEELGLEEGLEDTQIKLQGQEETLPSPSPSYPGLKTLYDIYIFEITLNDSQYQPSGYETEEGVFRWRKISP